MDRSTIGADCSLGPNTVVVESHIFDDVRIGANCILDNCMIGRNVEIADNVKIGRGVLLGDGVKLGKGVNIPDFHRVGRERFLPEYYDEEDEIESEEEKSELKISDLDLCTDFSSTTRSSGRRVYRVSLAHGRGRSRRRL